MSKLKTFGLAAMAAMALMALVASSAWGTKLYSGATALGWGTIIDATPSGFITFETLEGTTLDTCNGGTMQGSIINIGSSSETVNVPLEYSVLDPDLTLTTVSGLTWSGCSKTTDTIDPGELEIHWISGSINGTLTASGIEVTINTIFGSCVYGSAKALDLGTLVGSDISSATISINTKVPKISGNLTCPGESRWTATYIVTKPSPLHVTAS